MPNTLAHMPFGVNPLGFVSVLCMSLDVLYVYIEERIYYEYNKCNKL